MFNPIKKQWEIGQFKQHQVSKHIKKSADLTQESEKPISMKEERQNKAIFKEINY